MNTPPDRHALYYPFHLCHERSLLRLLDRYNSVHFRDYMALRLTPMSGTTAYQDRMGDRFPDLVQNGRIVQGYNVSGPLDPSLVTAVDQDLADQEWRSLFHNALSHDRRFQHGLFDLSHAMRIGHTMVPGPAALLALSADGYRRRPYDMAGLIARRASSVSLEDEYGYEYGLGLLKTSASLAYTIRLAATRHLSAVTDSEAHFRLLEHTCRRERVSLENERIVREGY